MGTEALTSPNGNSIDIHPIRRDELGRVLIRCLPDGTRIETLFKMQEVVGMGAWDGDKCIAQLHCYRLTVPGGSADLWPAWTRPPYVETMLNGGLDIAGPVWCHACFHVGRSTESYARSDEPDARYFGRGIGTALARSSVEWAREKGYAAVAAPGTPANLFAFAVWAGGLPWTTYARLGFTEAATERGDDMPDWTKDNAPPDVMAAVKTALADGRPAREFHSRLMLLKLMNTRKADPTT
jgi:GNAT superfamily N-acetyltransferase